MSVSFSAWMGGSNDYVSMPVHQGYVHGGSGTDILNFLPSYGGLVLDLDQEVAVKSELYDPNANVTAELPSLQYSEFEQIFTTNHDDVVLGTNTPSRTPDILFLAGGNDEFRGGDTDDFVFGGNDLDRLFGGEGNDTLMGDSGNDTIFGGAHGDDIDGGADRDHLHGESGNDVINGGSGNDFIDGGEGVDELQGGADADQFVFLSRDTGDFFNGFADAILDFEVSDTIRIPSGLTEVAATLSPGLNEFSVTDQGDHFLVTWRDNDLNFHDVIVHGDDPSGHIIADWSLII
ncbi:MAG: hypothetical protein ABJH45_21695 [Paracoccaceae bacterium]